MRYSVLTKNRIFVKSYGFLSFAENMGKNIGKHIRKTWVVNTAKKLLIMHAKQSATDAFKTASKRVIKKKQKKTEATGDLIGNKTANKMKKVSKNLQQVQTQLQIRMIKK